jgi:hypothetical protein
VWGRGLVGGEWSASCPGRLTPRYLLGRSLGGIQNRSGRHGEDKFLDPIGTGIPTVRMS